MKTAVRRAGRALVPCAGIIGAGRLGSALAWHLRSSGFRVLIADRVPARARAACRFVGRSCRRLAPAEVAGAGGVLFLTVPDRVIPALFISVRSHLKPGTLVVHCAGSSGIELFGTDVPDGVETLALHPVQSFADRGQAARSLRGCWFGIDGSTAGMRFGRSFVRRLGGRCIRVTAEQRPLYHAMCVFVSNFECALLDAGQALAQRLGLGRATTGPMLAALARTVLDNSVREGVDRSLTGPVERGDAATVRRHLAALADAAPELGPLYRAASQRLVVIARRRGLEPAAARGMLKVLSSAGRKSGSR